jgi:hypothetical protein
MLESWNSWPASARWISAILGIWIIAALLPALRSDSPAAVFGINLVTYAIGIGLQFAVIALAIWGGVEAASLSKMTWLGWLTGIFLLISGFAAADFVARFFGVERQVYELGESD